MAEPMIIESVQNGQMQNGLTHQEAEEPKVNGLGEMSNGPVENHIQNSEGEKKSSGDNNKSSSDKHKSSSSSHKHKSSHSDKHRDGHHKSSSSSSSHKHSSDKDKHRSSSSHKPSSSSGDKHRSSSHHSSSSKDKDGKHHTSSSGKHSSSSSHKSSSHKSSSSSSKHHSSSSSSKDKHSSSSSKHHSTSSSDKHRSDKDKHRSSSDKNRSEKSQEDNKLQVKKETEDMKPAVAVKTESVSPKKSPVKVKAEVESDDDVPLSARHHAIKKEGEKRPAELSDADDDEPLSNRMQQTKKIKTEEVEIKAEKVKKRKSGEEDEDFIPSAKKKKKEDKKKKKVEPQAAVSPTKKGKVKKEDPDQSKTWKWWEEEDDKKEEGIKWRELEHKGVVFAPEYERLPKEIRFYYEGKPMKLSQDTEEVCGFYAKMLSHDYTTREVFNGNFMKDWRTVMTSEERKIITDLSKCNFKEIYQYYTQKSEERKAMSKEEKKKIKEQNEAIVKEYGFCTIDAHTEKVGNFRIEPPGLFRGRGDHPKQGMLKKRVIAEDIIINCSKGSVVPQPPVGHRWKEVRHDPSVTWLASWTENVQNQTKYVMLAATSKLKGQKDMEKYEVARRLHQRVDKIRATYKDDWKSKEMRIRQRAVALYFIDKLALRAGNEKDEDQADTVGCCSLRFEHIKLHEEKAGKENVVEFDFLGKDSIRYHNEVSVERRVFKNLQLFVENKNPGDDLFDRLNTTVMNKHLTTLMDGLTAKVFRTYNASRTLQEQLDLLTVEDDPIPAKTLTYNRANRAVAVLCNHQRAVSKNFGKQMENIQIKIEAKKNAIQDAKKDLKAAKSDYKALKTENKRKIVERKKKAIERLEEQLTKLEISMTDKDENKDIALGTSKLNYLDPRISVGWCKKWEVPLEKVYNKTQREKFAWAIEMAEADYKFTELDE